MDIFKFNNPIAPTLMQEGELLNGFTEKTWIERYREPGEFTLKAFVSSGLKDALPIGSFISHVDSSEIMIVENREINDNEGEPSVVTFTGRSFDSFFEQRHVRQNQVFPRVDPNHGDFKMSPDTPANQAVLLIKDSIDASVLHDLRAALPYVDVSSTVTSGRGAWRVAKRGSTLSEELIKLLEVQNLGIRNYRPGTRPGGLDDTNINVVVHQGVDRRSTVIFSYDRGEVLNADYLWSFKPHKTAVYMITRWVEDFFYVGEPTDFNESDMRVMFVDASDIDQDLTSAPTGEDFNVVHVEMQQRANEVLDLKKPITISKADIPKTNTKPKFRTDYDIGDLITVKGDYNEVQAMRVTEYVEIEDQNGEQGYPTLVAEETT